MSTLEGLEERFATIRANTDWEMDGAMLWGYFFTDPSADNLKAFSKALEELGFRYVDIYLPDLDEDEEEYFFLHVEKEEIHSPQTLQERNIQFSALADRYKLDSYDGWDVGPIGQ